MATYYVDPGGDNGNPGTEAEPWETVAYAATAVSAGDTVIYEDGTYDIGTQVGAWTSGTAGDGYVTHIARNSRLAIWEQTSYGTYAIRLQSESYIRFEGIVVQQETVTDVNRTFSLENCTYIWLEDVELTHCCAHCLGIFYAADHITVSNCEIHSEEDTIGNGRNGILLWGTGVKTNILITGCEIYHNPHTGLGNNLTCSTNDTYEYSDNYIHDNAGHCISNYNAASCLIESNICAGAHSWPSATDDANGIRLNEGCNAEVYFNVCYDNTGRGVSVRSSCDTVTIYNNTLEANNYAGDDYGVIGITYTDNADGDISICNNIIYHTRAGRRCLYAESDAEAAITTMDYNLWYDSTAEETIRRDGTTYGTFADYQAAGFEPNSVVSDDPDFTNQAAHDFTLQVGSPAIDAGVNVGLAYNGTAPDIGAFETTTSGIVTPSPATAIGLTMVPGVSVSRISMMVVDGGVMVVDGGVMVIG